MDSSDFGENATAPLLLLVFNTMKRVTSELQSLVLVKHDLP